MVKLAAEIVCLWKASSVFPSGKKYQGAGAQIGTGVFCISGCNTNIPLSSPAPPTRETVSAVQPRAVPRSQERRFAARRRCRWGWVPCPAPPRCGDRVSPAPRPPLQGIPSASRSEVHRRAAPPSEVGLWVRNQGVVVWPFDGMRPAVARVW